MFCETKSSLNVFVLDRLIIKWKDLARIDDMLTRKFVDSEIIRSHKITIEVTLDMPTNTELEKSGLYRKVKNNLTNDEI